MCGLVGYVTPLTNGFNKNELEAFEMSLLLNSLRGDDSTGVVAIDNKDVWHWRKAVGNPKRFLDSHGNWGELRNVLFQRGKVVFGHGRSATRGNVNAANAHPFDIKRDDGSHLILVHNGTLLAHQSLPGFTDHDVDSEWLAKTIATVGAEEALAEVNGAIATIWWDEKDKSLNFYRNYERPLWTAMLKSGGLIYNSEPEILKYLAHRYKLEYDEGPYELAPYTLCKIRPNDKLNAWDNKKINRKTVHSYPAAKGVQGPQSNFTQPGQHGRKGGTKRVKAGIPLMESTETGNTSEINPYLSGSDDWMLVEGYANFIEWDMETGVKKSHYVGGSWEEEMCAPPVPSLRKMYYRPSKRQIVELHEDPTDKTKVELVVRSIDLDVEALDEATTPPAPVVVPPPKPVVTPKACLVLPFKDDAPKKVNEAASRMGYIFDEVNDPDLAVTFRKGKPARWHTRNDKGHLIRHSAVSEQDYPTFFSMYENSEDGAWQQGQEVNLEYLHSEEVKGDKGTAGKPFIKAFCASIRPKMEVAVDFVFQTDQWSKEELKRIHFFKGSINWMRVLHKEERAKAQGTVVQIYLTNVKPVENAHPVNSQLH